MITWHQSGETVVFSVNDTHKTGNSCMSSEERREISVPIRSLREEDQLVVAQIQRLQPQIVRSACDAAAIDEYNFALDFHSALQEAIQSLFPGPTNSGGGP